MAAAALLVILVAGCFNPFDPRTAANRGVSQPPPRADSPRDLLRLFEWCWEHRAAAEYRELFTDDFRFGFATTDSTGTPFLDRGFTRDDELSSATHLFQGGDAHQPRANRITLDFDPPDLVAFPDSRPGKTDPWHKSIFTHVLIKIEFDEATETVSSSAHFFVVSGDSALIPQELKDRGFKPDPNRWYIERYEEQETFGVAAGIESAGVPVGIARRGLTGAMRGGAALPRAGARLHAASSRPDRAPVPATGESLPRYVTWGAIKVHYR